ncbi:YsnF/AvaK domain-containing protein [Deinococcus multiflagellatus]|uniref:YsnF/AvaK domain-containing protein n=1 Tax=Deinococcus multiflagellatus TaxID=1656887 RepID=A0ABW1ZGE8_9DEIO
MNKDRYVAGQVQIGKHVETRTENVTVPLEREEIVIERHVVSDARPVSGNVTLGAGTETVEVTLEAERANVSKQAYVTEEVEIGKRTVTEQQTVTETIGREVLDVNQNGQVAVQGTEAHLHDGRNVAERAVDAVKDAVDPLDGKIDRR